MTPIAQWERSGFASPPEVFSSTGRELLLRAYSPKPINLGFGHGISRKLGNCFFVPSNGQQTGPIGGFSIDRKKWTGAFLEERLNAFFHGNAFERITVWALNPGVEYEIGAIGQATGYDLGASGGAYATGRYLPWPGGNAVDFRQVVLRLRAATDRDTAIFNCLRQLDDFAVVGALSKAGMA